MLIESPRAVASSRKRPLRAARSQVPLFRVNPDGLLHEVGELSLLYPEGTALRLAGLPTWPLDKDARNGHFDGLPYLLEDMRPQGFMGRAFARQNSVLMNVGINPAMWSDDDTLHVLSLKGEDAAGDLLLGDVARRRWQTQARRLIARGSPGGIRDIDVPHAYAAMADFASCKTPHALVGGEFPKFTTLRHMADGQQQHVLVKFSGSDDSPGTRRWADLLVCEHLAGQVLASQLNVAAATSRIHVHGGRTFLEIDRFDRHGALGRSPVVTWFSLNATMVGSAGRPWPEACAKLLPTGWLTTHDLATIQRVWLYGQLIANTDMHDGNLSFRPVLRDGTPGFGLAPIYDMLPMLYAPVRGVELPRRQYAPKLALPADRSAWQDAANAALTFWRTAAADPRIGDDFRRLCEDNGTLLSKLL